MYIGYVNRFFTKVEQNNKNDKDNNSKFNFVARK
jgi:hypothetical protein